MKYFIIDIMLLVLLIVVFPVDSRLTFNSEDRVPIIDNDSFNCSTGYYKDETMYQCCPCQSCDQYGYKQIHYFSNSCMNDRNLDQKLGLFCRVSSPTTDERCLYYEEVQKQRDRSAMTTTVMLTTMETATTASPTNGQTFISPTKSTTGKATVITVSKPLVIMICIASIIVVSLLIFFCINRPTINKTRKSIQAWIHRKKLQKRDTDEKVQMGLTHGLASESKGLLTGNQQKCNREDEVNSKSIVTQVTQVESEIKCKDSNGGSIDGGPHEYLPGNSTLPSIPPSYNEPPPLLPTAPNSGIAITGNVTGEVINVGPQYHYYNYPHNHSVTSSIPPTLAHPPSSSITPLPRSFSDGSSCSSSDTRSSLSQAGQRDANSRVEEVERYPRDRIYQNDHEDQKVAMRKHSASQHPRLRQDSSDDRSSDRGYKRFLSDTTRPYTTHQVSVHAESDDSSGADSPPIQVTLSDEEDIYSANSSSYEPRRPPDDSFGKS